MKMSKFEIVRPFLGAAAGALAMMFAPAAYSDDPITDAALQIFQAPDVQPFANFGWSVAAGVQDRMQDKILVGAPTQDVGGLTNAGQVYLFDQDGTPLRRFQAPDAQAGALFGVSIAAVQEKVLVSAPLHNVGGVDRAGQVYLFNPDGTLLQTFQAPKPTIGPIRAPNAGVGTRFGRAVAVVSGQLILVGADENHADQLTNAGRAYLFGTDGTLLRSFQAPDAQEGARFGFSVAAVEDKVLVSAPLHNIDGADFAGKAYLFDLDGTLLKTFQAPDPWVVSRFGFSVAGAGDKVLVGAIGDFRLATGGQAYLFDQDGALIQTFQAPHPQAQGRFGWSVASVEGEILVGAIGHYVGMQANAGQAYLFNPDGTLLQTFQAPDARADAQFGFSVAGVGELILVGANRAGANVGCCLALDAGQAYLFPEPTPEERIDNLITSIEDLVADGTLSSGTGTSLTKQLENALKSLGKGKDNAAINQIAAFANEVQALIDGGVLTAEDGLLLIDVVLSIIDQILAG